MKTKDIFNPLTNNFDVVRSEVIPIFLDETSTIADFEAGGVYLYAGNAPIEYNYDLIPYPTPTPSSGFDFINFSVHNVAFQGGGGNTVYTLTPNQRLRDVQVFDNGGLWDIAPVEYIDNIYNLQAVTSKGNTTTEAIFVRNNPDNYRTRYSTIGSQIQYDTGDAQVDYTYNQISIRKPSLNTRLDINFPNLAGNTFGSTYNITFRPNVSGTVAYLSDITGGSGYTDEQAQDAVGSILTDTSTIDFTYNDAANQITADVIDNSVTNNKLAQVPANSVIGNNTNATANAQYISTTPMVITEVTLIDGVGLVIDSNITVSSKVFITATSTGVLSSVPLRVTCIAGQCTIANNQVGDNALINVQIFY